jgi:hypothetical protein
MPAKPQKEGHVVFYIQKKQSRNYMKWHGEKQVIQVQQAGIRRICIHREEAGNPREGRKKCLGCLHKKSAEQQADAASLHRIGIRNAP